jgi:sugar phosphate isomerase/epimerase
MQNYEVKNQKIKDAFLKLKKENPLKLQNRLKLSWSNWGFGIEPLDVSCERLAKAGVRYVELHGNHYGSDLGYRIEDTRQTLAKHGIKAAGICGMFSADSDLSSNKAVQRQTAVDYLKREIRFCADIGGSYILVVPGAVGRNKAYDDVEFERSVETLNIVTNMFVEYQVRAAIEPIRSAEVSFVHTVADAKRYIVAVNHPGVRHINGDLYHMQSEESHIGEAIIDADDMLINLHLADSNRCALGEGSLDIDTVIMALYLIGYNEGERYVTPEPLGPGGDPYPAIYGRPDPKKLDDLVNKTITYFRQREKELLEV